MTAVEPGLLSHARTAIEMAATVAFALSGVIEGARKRLDAVGICVVAGLAAFGGGTIRDVLLQRRPLQLRRQGFPAMVKALLEDW